MHNERKVSWKTKGQNLACYQYLGACCLHFVMPVHFSMLEWKDFPGKSFPSAHCGRERGRILWSDRAIRQYTPLFAESGGKSHTLPVDTQSCHVENTRAMLPGSTLLSSLKIPHGQLFCGPHFDIIFMLLSFIVFLFYTFMQTFLYESWLVD